MKKIFEPLEKLNWNDFEEVSNCTQGILKTLSHNTDVIKLLLKELQDNPKLVPLCEKYDFLTKIALYSDETNKFHVRLHLFSAEYANRLHFHRWYYSSIILSGGYQHFLYGTEDQFNETTQVQDFNPIMVREENPGSVYTLNHNIVHSVIAQPNTLTLIIRGPSVKDRFLVLDRKTNMRWWQYGSKSETIEERKEKSISADSLGLTIKKVFSILDSIKN